MRYVDKRKRKEALVMKKITVLLTVLALVLSLCACSAKNEPATWQEQYDLGIRYLSEGNYEEAILAFHAAIEIDPKRTDAYIGLADAYEAIGDAEKARQILEDALAAVSEPDVIQNRLDGLSEGEPESPPASTLAPTPEPSSESAPESASEQAQEPALETPEPEPEAESELEPVSLTLSDKEVNMYTGNRYQLHANGVPGGTQVTWTSSSNGITIDRNGLVTANNDGYEDLNATITASYQYNGKTYSDSCTVKAEYPRVGASFSDSGDITTDLAVGETSQIKYETNIPNAVVRYRISGDTAPGVVSVDSNGRIEAIGVGIAAVIVSAIYNTDLRKEASTTYWGADGTQVDLAENEYFDVVYITTFDPSWYFGSTEETIYLNNPPDAMGNDYTRYHYNWNDNTTLKFNTTVNVECRDPSVAVIDDSDGVSIKAVGVGTTTAVATWTYGGVSYSQSLTITVMENVSWAT